jgi:hypothetical protein
VISAGLWTLTDPKSSGGETQCSVAAHGKTCNAARLAAADNTKVRLDMGNEFRQEKIAVALMTVRGVDEECPSALDCYEQEVANRVPLAQVFDQPPASTLDQCLLALTEAMEKIQDRIFLVALSFVGGWQQHAIPYGTIKNLARETAAIDSALSGCRMRESDDGRGKAKHKDLGRKF